ncbi:hypothetical protein ANO14919_118070 [Xylariales sp. No.14919]|nr:hypothetical protein ANO14919_118070 [Xylariales sp. No.14919]
MATDTIFADLTLGDPDNYKPVVIVFVVIISAGCICFIIYVVYLVIRTRSGPPQVVDIEHGLNGEPIPLQVLPPVRNAEIVYPETANPQFSTSGLPPPRPPNEFSMALSSNPPSQADLDTAKITLLSNDPAQDTAPVTYSLAEILEEEPPHDLGHSHPSTSQHHGLASSKSGKDAELPAFLGTSPKIEAIKGAPSEHSRRQKRMTPRSEYLPPSTIKEESSTPDIVDGTSASVAKLATPIPHLPHGNSQSGDNEGHAQDGKMNDMGGKSCEPNQEATDCGPSFQGQPQPARRPQSTSSSKSQYGCLQREYTHPSLVPEPLRVRRNNTVHNAPSHVTTTTISHQPKPRPASAIDVGNSPAEPEIVTKRPRSFVIREWPPARDNATATSANAAIRQALWYTPPSDEIIERSRQAREKMEWDEKARKYFLQKAKDEKESLSDEELEKRVRRMYKRSSLYKLQATTDKPPTSPLRSREASPVPHEGNNRVRAERALRPTSM